MKYETEGWAVMRLLHEFQSQKKWGVLLLVVLLFMTLGTPAPGHGQEDLSVISDWLMFTDAPHTLYHHLTLQAYQQLDARKATIQKLITAQDWRRRQQHVREVLQQIVGPFPEKTPLNPKITGVVQKDDYRVEKVLYESMPGFYVTAGLFIPNDLQGKGPAVLFCSGHTAEGFRSAAYQTMIINLVKKGFIVLAFDPVGQGERLQYYDPGTGQSRVGGPTKEHSYPGAQCFLSGRSLARYMIWDGIRSIDYLLTRPEVDPDRIGITGRSGGGTQSAYIAAFDDRIYAAAPENYLTSFHRLLQSIGPQDAEQNFYHGISAGIDHADLLEVRAPKPELMITTTRDFFSIQGARETYREASRAFEAFGKPGNLSKVEDDNPHGSTVKNREAMYAFFRKYLNLPGSTKDQKVELLTPQELQVTQTGQLNTSLGSETTFTLNKKETAGEINSLGQARADNNRSVEILRARVKTLSGYQSPAGGDSAVFTGRYQRDGYAVEMYFLPGEGDYVLPFLLFLPKDGQRHPAILYLHPEGKEVEAKPGGEIEQLVRQGYAVLAPDLPGIGELGPKSPTGDSIIGGISFNKWFASILIGRSIVGIQAGEVNRLAEYLKGREEIDSGAVYGMARGELTPVLLHAQALEPELAGIALVNPLISYQSLVETEYYQSRWIPETVAGALTAYDLPDLAALTAPGKLAIINPVNAAGDNVSSGRLNSVYSFVRQAYENQGYSGNLQLVTGVQTNKIDDMVTSVLSR